jgi:hypothetical protein
VLPWGLHSHSLHALQRQLRLFVSAIDSKTNIEAHSNSLTGSSLLDLVAIHSTRSDVVATQFHLFEDQSEKFASDSKFNSPPLPTNGIKINILPVPVYFHLHLPHHNFNINPHRKVLHTVSLDHFPELHAITVIQFVVSDSLIPWARRTKADRWAFYKSSRIHLGVKIFSRSILPFLP